MAEITAVMQKHDIGGFIMLASTTHTEFKFRVHEPSWSMLSPVHDSAGPFGWRLKMRKAEPEKTEKTEQTIGMIYSMRDMGAILSDGMDKIIAKIETKCDVTHNRTPIDRGPLYELKKSNCAGCENNFYNGGNPYNVAECWSFKTAILIKRKRVHINQSPPWMQKPTLMPSCYNEKQYMFINGDRTC